MTAPLIIGARPRTLPAAVVPVAVGTACAFADEEFVWWKALLALVVALAMQVGVNYANDYSDGVRGTDEHRVGPLRLVGSGLMTPAAVKRAAMISFAVGAVAGLVLAATTNWLLVLVGLISIAAAWFYTGGSRPYGYRGLGEVAVFVFFGLVATIGTYYVQTESISYAVIVSSIAVGSLAVALLVVNNLRDREQDALSGKHTLAVRLGDRGTRILFALVNTVIPGLAVIALIAAGDSALWALIGAAVTVGALVIVLRGAKGRELIEALKATARGQLFFGLVLSLGLVFA